MATDRNAQKRKKTSTKTKKPGLALKTNTHPVTHKPMRYMRLSLNEQALN